MSVYEKKIAITYVSYGLKIFFLKIPCLKIFFLNPKITVYRFLRVVFGLICSPFLLNATVKHHAKWKHFVEKFLRDLYVDDSTSGFDTVFAAYDFYLKAKSVMHDAGFDL